MSPKSGKGSKRPGRSISATRSQLNLNHASTNVGAWPSYETYGPNHHSINLAACLNYYRAIELASARTAACQKTPLLLETLDPESQAQRPSTWHLGLTATMVGGAVSFLGVAAPDVLTELSSRGLWN